MAISPNSDLPGMDDIRDAAERLRGHAVETPLLESPLLNDKLGGRLLLKAEVLQRTGSFKFRGAFNRISRIDAGIREKGVVAFSSGNHAQGVAAAARQHDISAVIVMPSDAPALKIANTRALGAEVVLYDRKTQSREELGEAIAGERGLTLVRPYDDFHVIAGQGTAGLELAMQAKAMGAPLDAVLVPVSGGGLMAGCALAIGDLSPGTEMYAVEPKAYDDTARSLATGERQRIADGAHSICDALQVHTPGELTFAINAKRLSGGLTVTDEQAMTAMAEAFTYFKLVIEPGGAVALAAVLTAALPVRGRTVAVVASGGNVDPDLFRSVLDRPGAEEAS